ncbi:MAG: hypothetical protein CVU97_00880 [Firmicutes bacterium HGW-Firmicutes-21]|nr:MAG: hypothetical protein CVU97_00880 [Firmicutes bacterium HGW-Firmicutes-21]
MRNKTKLIRIVLLTICFILLSGSIFSAVAIVPYTTYTYDVYGWMQRSPDAYVPLTVIDSRSIKYSYNNGASEITRQKYEFTDMLDLNGPMDIYVDDLEHVYIADSGNNRIVGLDENYNIRLIISTFTNNNGIPDVLSGPKGVFVTDSEIYVADTEKSRIVVFDKLGNFVDIVPEPSSDVMPDNSIYKPVAVAADRAGRVYVVSSTTHYGVISLNRDGSFNGFIGPQKVTYSAIELFWRRFQTYEQKAKSIQYVPTEYNNLTIDKDGFLYVTTASIDAEDVLAAIRGKSKSGDYAPVKKLNPNGSDVMNRNGFWPPSGEVKVNMRPTPEFPINGPSTIVDVALGPNNTWSIIDSKRSKIFTYDSNGNLLYVFGDFGDQIGNNQSLAAITYQGSNILLLDRASSSITVYKRTAYGDLIASAIQNIEDKNYEAAVDYYISILQYNNNYDSAYVGIGQSLYRDGEYLAAMQYFKNAYDTKNYSMAYGMYRKEWIENNVWVVPLIVVLLIILLSKFFKFVNTYNKKGQKLTKKRTFASEILYGFHVIFHPFDGFWDLKHENRGSVRGGTFWLGLTVFVFLYQSMGQGYLADQNPYGSSYIFEIFSVVLPLFLWAIANWCLTTLFDGEGTFKDVYIASCYAIVPVPLLIFPTVILSNFVIGDEIPILVMIGTMAFTWLGLLIFFAMMVIHDYTLGKNILTTIGTIIGVAFIMFIGVLFSYLLTKVFTFGYNIFVELKYRYWT